MKVGVATFPVAYSIAPADLARRAEALWFESLWFPDHSHIPVERATPWPGGDELPQQYIHVLDPIVAMGAAVDAGIDRAVLQIPSTSREVSVAALETFAEVASRFIG